MKKNFKFIAAIGIMAAVTAFSSCKKESAAPTDVTIKTDTTQVATIKGYIDAELDLTKTGKEAAAGQSVTISIPYSDFGYLNQSGKLVGKWTKTVTTGADGTFTVTVPTWSDGVNVTVTPADFVFDQVQPYDVLASEKTIKKYYTPSAANTSFKIATNGVKVYNMSYVDGINTNPSLTVLVQIKGTIKNKSTYTATTASALSAKTITLYTDGYYKDQNGNNVYSAAKVWSTKITTDAAGVYTTMIPQDQVIYAIYSDTYTSQEGTADVVALWDYKATVGTYSAYQTFPVDFEMVAKNKTIDGIK